MLKKVTAFLLALIIIGTLGVTVFADSIATYTITITKGKENHVYEAYQIFAGDLDSENKILSNVTWGTGIKGDGFLEELITLEAYKDCVTAQDVAEVLQNFENDSEELDAFSQLAGEYLTTETAGVSEQTKAPYTVEVTGDGYYLVKDRDETVTADGDVYTKFIIQVVKDVEVEVKADAPYLLKKIVEGEDRVDANNGSVGDTVYYELTSKVPEMDGYDKYFYVIHDTFCDGLEWKVDSVAVKIGNTTLDDDAYQVLTDELADGCTFEIVLNNFIQYKNHAGESIVVTYEAIIDQDAVIGNLGNENRVYLQYSNNPNVDQDGETDNPDKPGEADDTGKTPEDIVVTYVTGIELLKIDDAEEENPLTGAEFTIEGVKLNQVKDINGTYTEAVNGKVIAFVNEKGQLHFKGLAEGTYVITEITAPDGYNLLKKPITVEITCEEPEEIGTGEEQAVWKYKLTGAIEAEEQEAEEGIISLKVVNKSGTILPVTGGIGTTLFYIFGVILILGGSILLVMKSCTDEEE